MAARLRARWLTTGSAPRIGASSLRARTCTSRGMAAALRAIPVARSRATTSTSASRSRRGTRRGRRRTSRFTSSTDRRGVLRMRAVPRTRSAGPRARKALGQHFLRDSGVLGDIVAAVRVPAGGVVLEIGAGTGQLTEALLEAGHEVVALEIEERLTA